MFLKVAELMRAGGARRRMAQVGAALVAALAALAVTAPVTHAKPGGAQDSLLRCEIEHGTITFDPPISSKVPTPTNVHVSSDSIHCTDKYGESGTGTLDASFENTKLACLPAGPSERLRGNGNVTWRFPNAEQTSGDLPDVALTVPTQDVGDIESSIVGGPYDGRHLLGELHSDFNSSGEEFNCAKDGISEAHFTGNYTIA